MGFIEIQILIFLSIVISAILGGKKAAFLATMVWALETFIVYKVASFNYLQVISLAFSFQIAIIIGVAKDAIIKIINKKKAEVKN